MSTLRTYNLQNPDSSNVNIELTQGSGAVVAGVATFSSDVRVSGNLTVDGVLTYDDVTNIDSVGVVTARNGLHVTGGNLGVGLNNPSAPLHLSGPAEIRLNNATDAGNFARIRCFEVNGDNGAHLVFNTGAGEVVRFQNNGTIGINSTTPHRQLVVGAGGDISCLGPNGGIYFGTSTGGFRNNGAIARAQQAGYHVSTSQVGDLVMAPEADKALIFSSGSTNTMYERLRITTGGNIGIGENNPQNSLHISGSSPAIRFADTGANASAFSIIEDNNGLFKIRNDAGNSGTGSGIAFEVDAGEKLRIDSSARVIIDGSASGNNKLQINGTGNDTAFVRLKRTSGAGDDSAYGGINVVDNNDVTIGTAEFRNQDSTTRSQFVLSTYNVSTSGLVEAIRIKADQSIIINAVPGTNNNADQAVLFQTATGAIDGGSGLLYNPGQDVLKVNGNHISTQTFRGSGNTVTLSAANSSSTSFFKIDNGVPKIQMATDKVIQFSPSIGEIGSVTGFQATNTAGSANTDFGIRATTIRFATGSSEKLRIESSGQLTLKNSPGIKLSVYNSSLYAQEGTLSYYGTNNYVYLNGAGPNGGLRLNAAGTENYHNCVEITGSNAGAFIMFRSQNNERLRIANSVAAAVHVKGETALTGTTGDAKGLSIATGGGTSCPLYFGNETHSAQKSMYLNGYWIYLRGHQNEGIRFVFSQGSGNAPRSDQYQFKYNQATRPTGNTTWDGFSDRRAKENVQDVTSALDTICRLRPVTFDWTNDYADRMNMFNMDKTDPKSYNWFSVKENGYDETRKNNNVGFIAQEFEEVFPKDITETEMELGNETITDFKTVNFDSLVPMLTKAVQELKAENDSLRARLDAAGL